MRQRSPALPAWRGRGDAVAQVRSRGGEKERDEVEEESETEQHLGPTPELLVRQVHRPVWGRGDDTAFRVDAAAVVAATRQGVAYLRADACSTSTYMYGFTETKHACTLTGGERLETDECKGDYVRCVDRRIDGPTTRAAPARADSSLKVRTRVHCSPRPSRFAPH